MHKVKSADGTRIAFDREGEGAVLIVVCGATCDRALMRPTAHALAARYDVINFDRRGRGDSDDTPPYAIEREIEDIAALIAEAGGTASLYGHSSGAALVLHAAAAGLPVEALILHEAPYNPDDEAMKERSRAWSRELAAMLADGRHGDAMAAFMAQTGMPQEMIDGLCGTPRWAELEAMAPTLAYDSALMGDRDGGLVPVTLAARVHAPALVLCGHEGPGWMIDVNRQLANALPNARLRVLEGEGHVVDPARLAPVVAEFLDTTARPTSAPGNR
jgi:pimeloyl-ACP methyl ester carboxylesterase